MRRATVNLVSRLLEWTDKEAEHYLSYYRDQGAVLSDYLEAAGYTLSLFHYKAENIFEVNINAAGLDFLDPAVQRARQSVTGYMPRHRLVNKLKEWLNKAGHLVMGSHDSRKVALYKRLFARELGGKIVDFPRPVKGGHYFFILGWDRHAPDRIQLPAEGEAVAESVDPMEFIEANPSIYDIIDIGPGVSEVYASDGYLMGKVYDGRHDIPPEANQFWRDYPWMADPDVRYGRNQQSFKTQQEAVDWLCTLHKKLCKECPSSFRPWPPTQAPT